MRKVIFTEAQIRKIFIQEGVDNGLDRGGGYLTPDDGSGVPDNITGTEVFADPIDFDDRDTVTTGDKIAHTLNPRRAMFGFGTKYAAPIVEEDIDDETYTLSKQQMANAASTNTKMGKNMANSKTVSDGTQRKRKHDLKIQKNKLGKDEFERRYGPIAKTVAASLSNMSNKNKVKNSFTDTSKLNTSNDVTKVKTNVGTGHHKDGENLYNNGTVHYFD